MDTSASFSGFDFRQVAGWAAMGQSGDLNRLRFDYSDTVSLLVTGFYGDVVWSGQTTRPELLRRTGRSGARFSEGRLPEGIRFSSAAWVGIPSTTDIFLWANGHLKNHYFLQFRIGSVQ
tara:strand:+ start:5959 stop:6315 length:357 start_codon:yes stop_codon:yes gene_type:complete